MQVNGFVLEKGVCNHKPVGCADVQQPLAIVTDSTWQAKASNATLP